MHVSVREMEELEQLRWWRLDGGSLWWAETGRYCIFSIYVLTFLLTTVKVSLSQFRHHDGTISATSGISLGP